LGNDFGFPFVKLGIQNDMLDSFFLQQI